MPGWTKDEVEAAVVEYLTRGEQSTDYDAWSQLFTDDAVYVEHSMGVFVGRDAIRRWIVACMGEYSAVTNWTEWFQIDGSRVVIYAWNNFPAPSPSSPPRQFPSVSVLRYAGDGMFVRQDDFYDGAHSEQLAITWAADGGNHVLARDFSIRGIDGFQPPVSDRVHDNDEVSTALATMFRREAEAARSGDWRAWADSFTDEATLRADPDAHLHGRDQILVWVASQDPERAGFEPRVLWHMIERNRVVARVTCAFADAVEASYDRMVILHYAGDGRWSYREDVFNRNEAAAAAQAARR